MPYGTTNRASEFDLGLSPRDTYRLGSEFAGELLAMCSNSRDRPNSIWREVSEAARKRAGIGPGTENSICIPTAAAIWPCSQADQLARQKWAQRAGMLVGTPDVGGYLVGTENISFIELLRNRAVVFQMGARRMSGLVGNVTIPKQTAGAVGYWLSTEATAITEADQTIAQVALTARTCGAYTTISRLLQLQSSPDAQALILSDLAQQVALAVDLAAIAGTGTEQPTGILGTVGVGTFSGTSLAAAGILDAQAAVASANALTAGCGFVFGPDTAALLMQRPELAATGIERLWKGNVNDGTLFGMRAMTSAQMPSATGIFGDFSQLIVGEFGVLELASNPATNFPAGVTGLRAMYSVDIAVRHAGAFSITSSIS